MITQETQPIPNAKPSFRAWPLVVSAAVLLWLIGLYGYLRPRQTPLEQVKTQYLNDIAQLDSAVHQLQRSIQHSQSADVLQEQFRRARLRYKRVEFLTELYFPETAKSINGANIPEVDEADRKVEQPEGFQVLEELLFPYNPAQQEKAIQQASVLVSNVGRLGKVATTNELTDSHVFDGMRLEVFRLISLSITGFDSPVSHHSLPEASEALASLQHHLSFYNLGDHDTQLARRLDSTFTGAIDQLKQAPDFNQFDRLNFITHHANVLSALLLDAQQRLSIPVFKESRLLSPSARTLSDPDAFNPNHFVNSIDDRATPARIALGKLLFYDPILSGDGQRTCATCHQPDKAFTDGESRSLAIGGQRVRRNAPTLMNSALQATQFTDSRVVFLEDQASDVIQNVSEMHGSLPVAVKKLQHQETYRRQFTSAYKEGVTEHTLKNALASYVRSLTYFDSRVDRYLRGQTASLTNQEKLGFNLFMGKAQCATCHFYPLFNGTVPPAYEKTESEVLGTPATSANRQLDPDLGKFHTTTMDPHRYAFKTPTVRQTAKTAPYMHNGVYQTLEQVVDFYNEGGGNGLGFGIPNQTLPDSKLALTKAEQAALVAFMKAL
ncbi:cytochrome c peroxidase [Spirosoma sp. KUDC1026]|uniref:cytochrome c peroxidase n=1 Tax=Spirosoma sp. KUDC1026 TaxID=2745947 RepID=UPI00159BC0E7|nr:cytochrome c peroxidase [Spirosoma sp. KUDC1026]QKZ15364.1 cytochrome-c peroxidase [Spirosoma sp. KUDC1026]